MLTKEKQVQQILKLLANNGTLRDCDGEEYVAYNQTEEHRVRDYVFNYLINHNLIVASRLAIGRTGYDECYAITEAGRQVADA